MIFDIEIYINKKLSKNVTDIDISHKKLRYIPNLSRFNNLISLSCEKNELTSLPELPNSLEKLNCSYNELTSLPKLPENLLELNCSHNLLGCLPKLPKCLNRIRCYNNGLTYLPKLPESLKRLNSENNKLTTLPELNEITQLSFIGNPIHNVFHNIKIIENEDSDDEFDYDGYPILSYNSHINTINKNIKILNNFRFLYYCLKFKNKFRAWLWEKVREPKIQQKYHPSRLLELLKDKDINDLDDLDDVDEEKYIL